MLEVLIIIAIALLLFGYRALPKLGRALGEAPRRFQRGLEDNE